jgi:predicted RNase H-like HicB family nuclease
MSHEFTAIYQRLGDNCWVGSIEELPGANIQGKTLTDTRRKLKEAVRLVLFINQELSRREVDERVIIREELEGR